MERYYISLNHVSHDDMKDSIEHSGILGMKWGQRRYQYRDGSWTEAGKARRRTSGSGRHMSFSQRRKAKKNLKKARAAASAKRAHDKEHERIVREGSAREAYAIRNELSNDEKRQIVERLNWDKQIGEISSTEKANNHSKAEKALKTMNTMATIAKDIGTFVDTASKVRKFMNDGDSNDNNKKNS